jgi:hypothetical protein
LGYNCQLKQTLFFLFLASKATHGNPCVTNTEHMLLYMTFGAFVTKPICYPYLPYNQFILKNKLLSLSISIMPILGVQGHLNFYV